MASKTQRMHLRVSEHDSELLRRAASIADESLTDFIVEGARERAERTVADRSRFVLSDTDWATFVAALERPVKVDQRLVDLFARPRPA